MMTPKEVQEHGFPQSRKGYDMAEVDDFLDALTEDYTALYNNYGKLSNSYTKLRKKAQALAAALEQNQSQPRTAAAAPAAPVIDTTASQAAADEILRAARKDAEAIRAGAEAERQKIIDEATDYAQTNSERLKAEVAQGEISLAALKKSTAEYITQVKRMINRQLAAMDELPVDEGVFSAMPVSMGDPNEKEPDAASLADEIARNLSTMGIEDDTEPLTPTAASDDLDATGSLFAVITGAEKDADSDNQFDEE